MALMFLNGDGMSGGRAHHAIEGAPLTGEQRAAPRYWFYLVRHEFPALYPADEGGQPVLGELYDVPMGPPRDPLTTESAELDLLVIELEAANCRSPRCCGRRNMTAASTGTLQTSAAGGPTAPAWLSPAGHDRQPAVPAATSAGPTRANTRASASEASAAWPRFTASMVPASGA
jgi:hypothetical protein